MPTLALTNFNIVCASLGGFITLFGLVSYLFKEKFYLSEARKSERQDKRSSESHKRSDIIDCWAHLLSACNKLDSTA
jgi:hypothetical protein